MSAQTQFGPDRFLQVLQQVAGDATNIIPLHEPEFSGNEWKYVKDCIDSGWVSSVGKYVDAFEVQLAEFTGSAYAIAVANGTAAQHIALLVAGVKPDDEVIIPALTFVATANAVAHCGAIPHFVDSSLDTLGLDVEALDEYLNAIGELTVDGLRNKNTGRRIAAIVPMHTFGHAMNIDALVELADRLGVPVVEDAAESLGTRYHGRHTGTFGHLGIVSFNGNKLITTGGGGAILTNNPMLAKRAKHLTTTAKVPHKWEFVHDEVAFNYRMPNLNAALGLAQLERVPDMLVRKRRLAGTYREAFKSIEGLDFVSEPEGSISNYWLNAIRLHQPDIDFRNQLLQAANDAGYQCRPVWTLLHKLPMYGDAPRANLPQANILEASLINIPSSTKLSDRS